MSITLDQMRERIAEVWSDAMELGALIDFFRDKQLEHLESLPESEVIELYNQDVKGK